MKQRSTRAPNGEGDSPSFSVHFDLSDPLQREAWEEAREMAREGHGVRKDTIVVLLAARRQLRQQLGRPPTAPELALMFLTRASTAPSTAPGFTPIVTAETSDIIIASGGGMTAEQIAANFESSSIFMADDDLWDD